MKPLMSGSITPLKDEDSKLSVGSHLNTAKSNTGMHCHQHETFTEVPQISIILWGNIVHHEFNTHSVVHVLNFINIHLSLTALLLLLTW